MPFEHSFADNEIKAFVHHIFALYDKHVDVEEILKCLVDTNLEMSFQGIEIRSPQDFRQWYRDVERNYEWNVHRLEQIDVAIVDHGRYRVDVVLRWEALTRGNREVVLYLVRQEWSLVEGTTGPKIARYIVTEFSQLPTPSSFQTGNSTGQMSLHIGGDAESERQVGFDAGMQARPSGYSRCGYQPPLRQCGFNDAVARNDLVTAEQLRKQGHDVNRRDADGFTPLMVAAGRGYVQMTHLLLTAGADPTMVDNEMGTTALHKAAQSGVVNVARLLVNGGAFLDVQAPTLGNTPLIDAVWHKRPDMVRYLLEQGARLEIMNRFGGTALSFAAMPDPDWYDLRLMSVNTPDELEDKGHSLVIVGLVGSDLLHIRIFDRKGEKVIDKAENALVRGEALTALKERLDPFPDESRLSQKDKQEIIKHAISSAGHTHPDKPETTKIRCLLKERQDLYKDMIKSQKLMAAVCRNDVNEVCQLIKNGVPLDEKAPLTSVPLDAPPLIGQPPSGLPTPRAIAGYTPLLAAALLGHADIVRELLQAPANPWLVDEMMRATPGHKAGYRGHADVARELVQDGRFELDAQGRYNGYTALHDAIWHGHLEAAQVFIDAGARLDQRTHTGHTPLELAIDYGYTEIAEIIEEKLAANNTPSSEGR